MVDASLPGPDVILEQDERARLLSQLIAELPAEKRAVFHLVYEVEMGTRQVAEELGIPEGGKICGRRAGLKPGRPVALG
jgi:RNA polymerase sigma factor (sigma-70 family)